MVALPMPDSADDADPAAWALDLRDLEVPALVRVRRWAARTLSALDDTHLGDVMLVATELVTNAYDHGDGPRWVRMSHTPKPCQVLIEVEDSCPAHPAVVRPEDTEPHGRGMLIVDKLAEAWGVREHPADGGKTVWARISCGGAES
jgi:anti-sigma regulatory factor (Ser/Thr protein kinase)